MTANEHLDVAWRMINGLRRLNGGNYSWLMSDELFKEEMEVALRHLMVGSYATSTDNR